MTDIDTTLLVAAVGAGSAIIASIISSLTYYFIERMRSENETRKLLLQRQEQAYSQLTGLKFVTIQLYIRLNDTFSNFEWIKARERLQLPSRSDLGKIEEERRKYDELALELARNNQRLWETIGLIRVLFSSSEDLDKLTESLKPAINKFRKHVESIGVYYKETTAESVDIPPYATTAGIEKEVIKKYVDIPFEALQEYLEDKIKAENIRAKSWWQIWRRV